MKMTTAAREWVKAHLPYGLSCAVARAINRPWLVDVQRVERLCEYTWALAEIGRYHEDSEPLADIGYAGGYFAEALTQFGPVTGVDPRDVPKIRHPRFHREWPWVPEEGTYGTVVCISALEHFTYPNLAIDQMLSAVHEGGQVLITVPVGPVARQFRGYRLRTLYDILEWPCMESFAVFARRDGVWECLTADRVDVHVTTSDATPAIIEHLPESTEHTVQAVAAVRLVRRPAVPRP